MQDLKHFKEAMVLNGWHSPFVKEMLTTWPTQNRVIPNSVKDWHQLFYRLDKNYHGYHGGGKKQHK